MAGKQLTDVATLLRRRFSGFVLFVLITILILLLYAESPQWLDRLDLRIQDLMYDFRGNLSPGDQVIIVGIDDKAAENVGTWPWHRDLVADLIYSISLGEPKVLFLDTFLPTDVHQDTSGNTEALASLMRELHNVIVPIYFNLSDVSMSQLQPPAWVLKSAIRTSSEKPAASLSALQIFCPSEKIGAASRDVGHINMIVDADGVARKEPLLISYRGDYYPCASLQIAKNYLGAANEQLQINGKDILLKDILIPASGKGEMHLNYNGPAKTFTQVSAWDLLSGRIDPQLFFHRIVLVGPTGPGSTVIKTPVSEKMTSVERTANVLENIIHKNFLTPWSFWFDILLLVLIGVFCAVVLPNVSLLFRMVILTVFFFVVVNLSFILFSSIGVLTRPVYPVLEVFLFLAVAPAIKSKKTRETAEQVPAEPERGIAAATEEREPEKEEQITSELTAPVEVAEAATAQKESKPSTEILAAIARESRPPEEEKGAPEQDLTNFGRYRILEPLGRGAMGMVYKGEDPAIDRLVALKTIRLDLLASEDEIRELKERLIREAQTAGKLSHPNIVTIYDVGEETNLQYIAMEYLKGNSLDNLIKKKTEPSYRIVAKIMIQVCDALSYAHQNGVIHRDIKPANIMILDDFMVKVMDFGIARFGAASMTEAGVAFGTPSYISPEQLQGKPADRRSDIFSTGVVLYEFLTRRKPFQGEDMNSVMYGILNETPAPPSTLNDRIPVIFDRIVAKAMAKDPDERYQYASEISAILKEFVSSFIVTRAFRV